MAYQEEHASQASEELRRALNRRKQVAMWGTLFLFLVSLGGLMMRRMKETHSIESAASRAAVIDTEEHDTPSVLNVASRTPVHFHKSPPRSTHPAQNPSARLSAHHGHRHGHAAKRHKEGDSREEGDNGD